MNQFKTKLEQVTHEERAIEKTFKKDFLADIAVSDGPIDQLSQIYKNHKLNASININDYGLEIAQKNPVEIATYIIDKFLADTTLSKIDEDQFPAGLAHDHLENFVSILQSKFDSDVRKKVYETMIQNCQAQQERLEKEKFINLQQKNSLQNEYNLICQNIENNFMEKLPLQLLLREGVCQLDGVDMTSGQEYSNCTLVEKNEIEVLNERILEIGKQKLDEMKKSIQFKQQIRLNQWELQRLTMKKEDLQEQIRHIQLFKLSKNVQTQIEGAGPTAVAGSGGTGSDKSKAVTTVISKLEKRLAVQQKMQEKQAKELKKKCRLIKIDAASKNLENEELSRILANLMHTVAERRILDDASKDRQGQLAKKKMQMIVKRRRLVEMAKAQAANLAVLHNELERMRMRTFPALTSLADK